MLQFSQLRNIPTFIIEDLTMDQEIQESFATNKAHAMGLKYMGFGHWGQGDHATHKNVGGNLVALSKPVHRDSVETDEGKKPMKVTDLPGKMKDVVLKGYQSSVGDSSPITRTHEKSLTSSSAVKGAIRDAMGDVTDGKAHGVLVTVDGKPIHVIKSNGGNYGRAHYNVTGEEGTHTTKDYVRGRHGTTGYYRDEPNLSKADALNHAQFHVAKALGLSSTGEDKDAYKGGRVEVHHIGTDPVRAQARKERSQNKPEVQYNYVKQEPKHYGDFGRKEVSRSNAGNMDDIRKAAASKFVDKHLGAQEGARKKSVQLHQELGDMIHSGADVNKIRSKMSELETHLRSQGNSETNPESEMIKKDLSDKGDWNRKWALQRIRDIKTVRSSQN